jgi:hypothetical protein
MKDIFDSFLWPPTGMWSKGVPNSVSTEVYFWNSAEVGIFSELVYTSAEFREKNTGFRKKYRYYMIMYKHVH